MLSWHVYRAVYSPPLNGSAIDKFAQETHCLLCQYFFDYLDRPFNFHGVFKAPHKLGIKPCIRAGYDSIAQPSDVILMYCVTL